jgi:hypothetical protein
MELLLLLGAYPAGPAKDKGFSLARFAQGRRERREKKKVFPGRYLKGSISAVPAASARKIP